MKDEYTKQEKEALAAEKEKLTKRLAQLRYNYEASIEAYNLDNIDFLEEAIADIEKYLEYLHSIEI